jgi:CRISPR/Cas system-associated exonuclease Cas4 (RecB family)
MDEFSMGIPAEPEQEAPKKSAKARMYTIFVDEEENELNFIKVAVNGVPYQIQRGVDVIVPESVVEVLRNAIAERLVQTTNPVTGLIDSKIQNYSRIPWRIVRM